MKLTLPKRENLAKTTWEDSLDLYYTPFIRDVYLHRFKLAVELLSKDKYESMLDIGFGCGIFLKELCKHTRFLCGIDVHDNIDKVCKTIEAEGFLAELKKGSIFSVPYNAGLFDCVISMSVLEHLNELDIALLEINRVARVGADIILGFPVRNFFTNTFFRVLGYNPMDIHPSSHNDILKAIGRHFKITRIMKFPKFIPVNLVLYLVVKCRK